MPIHVRESDVPTQQGPGQVGAKLLGEAQGCVKGFCMGVATYHCDDYAKPGIHDDQEGFYVLSGKGMARVGKQEIPLEPGVLFLAAKGVPHAVKRIGAEPVKLLWAHGAV